MIRMSMRDYDSFHGQGIKALTTKGGRDTAPAIELNQSFPDFQNIPGINPQSLRQAGRGTEDIEGAKTHME